MRLIANGIDADLAVTNNATGLDFNDNQFKVAGVWYFDHALNTSTENTSGIITVKKAGNKVYQHEILENGQAANRVLQAFNGCRGSIKLARYKVLLRLFLLMITLT